MTKPLNQKPILLIVEDDQGLQSQLRWHFDQYETIFAENRADAVAAVRLHEAAVIIQDLGLPPDEDGVDEGFWLCHVLSSGASSEGSGNV